jgi:putative flippase GtrA
VRYAAVGGASALLHNAIMIGGDRLGFGVLACGVVSFAVVVVFSYGLHAAFTFRVAGSGPSFLRYVAAMAMNYPFAVGLIFALQAYFHLPMALASPATTGILFLWNFGASRWALVRPRGRREA